MGNRQTDVPIACSWCGRVRIFDQPWQEAEVAVSQMKSFDDSLLPSLSHGICPECYKKLSGPLKNKDLI